MPTSNFIQSLRVDEDIYKADLAILDRYQSFSAELLRIALLGISGYGFLATNLLCKEQIWSNKNQNQLALHATQWFFAFGLIALGATTAMALAHRYYSTDSVTHLVKRIRLMQRLENMADDDPQRQEIEGEIEQQKQCLRSDFCTSSWLFKYASIALFIGALCVAATFIIVIFIWKPTA